MSTDKGSIKKLIELHKHREKEQEAEYQHLFKQHQEQIIKNPQILNDIEEPSEEKVSLSEELVSNTEKHQFYIYQLPKKVSKKDEDEKDEEKEKSIDLICIIIVLDENGKVLAYSIGHNGFSDNFHDVSHLDMNCNDFKKELLGILDSSLKEGLSIPDAISAVKEKFPGQRTYTDKPLQERANEAYLKKNNKNEIEGKDAGPSAITPLSTIPKPL
jgi:hypothetical protein